MFSTTRNLLHSSSQPSPLTTATPPSSHDLTQITFHKVPQTAINVRTTSDSMRNWIHDQNGLNLLYGGEAFSATIMPLKWPKMYVALTIPSGWLAPDSRGEIAKNRRHPSVHGEESLRQLEHDPGWKDRGAFPLWTAKKKLGRSEAWWH
ncbi:hypothetical protein IAR50_004975 [Cryptococcus sp. DSM 104548]